jgi:ABC-type polysaccharide/polyol phosphate export permease
MLLVRRTRAVVAYRRVLWLLIVRELKVRYAGSFLGYLWTVLDPLLMTAVYWFVFTQVLGRNAKGEKPYIVFLILGLLAWQWFSSTVSDATGALVTDSRLVRSTNIPREIWVLKTVGAKGLEYLFSLPVVVLFMVLYRVGPSKYIVVYPIGLALEAILLTGIGLILSAVTVLVRDLQRLVRIALRVGFYTSPIVYGLLSLDHKQREFFMFNPLTGIIECYRALAFPAQFAGWSFVGVSAAISVVLLVVGIWVFNRLQAAVLKEI